MRLLVYRSIHADELCLGGDGAGRTCPKSNEAQCSSCGTSWEADDTSAPGKCPKCAGWNISINRCLTCPVEDLLHVRVHSYAGRLFDRLLELEFDMSNLSVPWSDVTAEEVKGLQILKDERDKFTREQIKRQTIENH